MTEQLMLPLAVGQCGYCGRPITGRQCEHCAPRLARVGDELGWVLFHRRARRERRQRR